MFDAELINPENFPELDKEEEARARVENSPLARLLRNEAERGIKNKLS